MPSQSAKPIYEIPRNAECTDSGWRTYQDEEEAKNETQPPDGILRAERGDHGPHCRIGGYREDEHEPAKGVGEPLRVYVRTERMGQHVPVHLVWGDHGHPEGQEQEP